MKNTFTPAPPMPHNWANAFGPAPHLHFTVPTGEVPFLRHGQWFLYVKDNKNGDLCEYNFRTDIAEKVGRA